MDLQAHVAIEILGMRDLLYANIISYSDYQRFIKKIFKQNKLTYKFQVTIENGKMLYTHLGKCKNFIVEIYISKTFIDFEMEGDW